MKLREYIMAHGVKVNEMARAVGVHRQTINDWIRGRQKPKEENYRALFAATNGLVTPADFYDLKPINKPLTRQLQKSSTKNAGHVERRSTQKPEQGEAAHDL